MEELKGMNDMNVNVVLHIDVDDNERLTMAIGNFNNLLKEISMSGSGVCLLANGSSVKLLTNDANPFMNDIKALSEKGVRFYICNNSLTKFQLSPNDMLPQCEVVRAGVLKLIELQSDGYAYIKP